jgi:23S rRNA (uracil1939-C5)-methyltransferase
MAQGGEAIGRDETGRVVFVPYAIAGEEVVVEIVEEKKNYARARLVEIITSSPARVSPRCEHFGKCGGCQWQHIAYDAQLRFKTDIVREQLARIGKIADAPVRDTIGMTDPWHYRNNVQFQLDDTGRLCFRAMESHALVPIRECHIIHPLLAEMFRALEFEGADFVEVTLRAGTRTGEKLLMLEGRDEAPPEISVDEPISIAHRTPRGDVIPLVGKDALHEELRGRLFRVSPQSFFQVNTTMAETLIELVERYLAPRPSDVLLDAFGGVGTFGLLLAPRVARVIEIEEAPDAVNDAKANAVELMNVEFQRGKVEDILPKSKSPIDLVVADPPRAGIAPTAREAIITQLPRAIAYVSCDPATLARDARQLVNGGYRLVEVQPVDMFPQTCHIETVSLFARG